MYRDDDYEIRQEEKEYKVVKVYDTVRIVLFIATMLLICVGLLRA